MPVTKDLELAIIEALEYIANCYRVEGAGWGDERVKRPRDLDPHKSPQLVARALLKKLAVPFFKIGDRVRINAPRNPLLVYEMMALSGATGTVLRFRNGKFRVEVDNTSSQDTEGHNSYSDFEEKELTLLSRKEK